MARTAGELNSLPGVTLLSYKGLPGLGVILTSCASITE